MAGVRRAGATRPGRPPAPARTAATRCWPP